MDNMQVVSEMDDESCTGSDDLVEYTLEEQEEEQDVVNSTHADDLEELMEVSSVTEDPVEEELRGKDNARESKPAKTIINAAEMHATDSILKSLAAWDETNKLGDKIRNKVTMIPQSCISGEPMKLLNSTQIPLPSATATTSYRLVSKDGTMVMNVASQSQSMKKVISISNTNVLQQPNSKMMFNQNTRLVHIQPQLTSTSGNVVKTVTLAKQSPNSLTMKTIPASSIKGVPQTATSSGGQKTFVHMTKACGQGVTVASPRIINSIPPNGNNEATKVIIKAGNTISTKKIVSSPNLPQRYMPAIKGVQYVRLLNQQAATLNSSPSKMTFQSLNKVPSANTPITAVTSNATSPVGTSKILLQNNRTYVVRNGIAKVATAVSTAGVKPSVLPANRKILLGDNIQSPDKVYTGPTRIVVKKADMNSMDTKPVRMIVTKLPQNSNRTSSDMKDDSVKREKSQQLQQLDKSEGNVSGNKSGGKVIQDDTDAPRKYSTAYGFPEEAYKKRPCNCTKSQCLKLYCDCFANGEFCYNCNCKDCYNTFEHENERQKAIRCTLERNPNAFKPKIGSIGATDDGTRLHTKGCNCKRSGCLKNYCECYEAKIPCSSNCKCVGCRNTDQFAQEFDYFGVPDSSTKSADEGAIKRVSVKQNPVVIFSKTVDSVATQEQHSVSSVLGGLKRSASCIEADLSELPPAKQPHNFMTLDVIEATVQCMVAQADECLKRGCSIRTSERMILEEYGRCLLEIKEFAFKTDN